MSSSSVASLSFKYSPENSNEVWIEVTEINSKRIFKITINDELFQKIQNQFNLKKTETKEDLLFIIQTAESQEDENYSMKCKLKIKN